MQGICVINGCGQPHLAQGFCNRHYKRLRKYGDPEHPNQWSASGIRGVRLVCVIPGCGGLHQGKGYCNKHYQRLIKYGDPLALKGRDRPCAVTTYKAMHAWLARKIGPATDLDCVQCGAPADDWAYDHADPNERSSEFGPWSTDCRRYEPMCRSCHRQFDNGRHASPV